jgi:hypothetical protein
LGGSLKESTVVPSLARLIPTTDSSRPYGSVGREFLEAAEYVEEEFFLTGVGNIYRSNLFEEES